MSVTGSLGPVVAALGPATLPPTGSVSVSRWGRRNGPGKQDAGTANCGGGYGTAEGAVCTDSAQPLDQAAVPQNVEAPCKPGQTPSTSPNEQNLLLIYTIGTWRVSRESYLQQLRAHGVKQLVDVRGNPTAGRQSDMFKGKELTKALSSAGIRYEYWGDRLGEDNLESLDEHALRLLLRGLLASVRPGPVCMLGHLHEPYKCHRMKLCVFLPPDCNVVHFLWEDHRSLKMLSQQQAQAFRSKEVGFFEAEKEKLRQRRLEELKALPTPCTAVSGASRGGRWRHAAVASEMFDKASVPSTTAAGTSVGSLVDLRAERFAAIASRREGLPVVDWEEVGSTSNFQDMLRDGNSYRLKLPFDAEVFWYPRWLSTAEAAKLEGWVRTIEYYHPTYTFQTPVGITKETVNRKGQARVCDDFNYRNQYTSKGKAGTKVASTPFEQWGKDILHDVEAASDDVFNSFWINHYRDGTVTIQWHTDQDAGLGPNPIVGSLSLGASRDFSLKTKRMYTPPGGGKPRLIHLTFPLVHGSLIVMGKNVQTNWLHAVPAMEGVCGERLNLTFRFYAIESMATDQTAEEAKEPQESVPPEEQAVPFATRLRLVPTGRAWSSVRLPAPVRVDMPDAHVTAAEYSELLPDTALPAVTAPVRLAVRDAAGEWGPWLAQEATIQEMLGDQRTELVDLRVHAGDDAEDEEDASVPAPTGQTKKPVNLVNIPEELLLELEGRPPVAYAPLRLALATVEDPEGGDWVLHVIQSLSGIQRKSKGSGKLTRHVFHQSNEFCALYVGRPKSTVHLVLAPKRPLRRALVSESEAGLVKRLGDYAAWLSAHFEAVYPQLRFAAGFRQRQGRVQQLHAHLISLDLVTPRIEDLGRRHYDDFVSGRGSRLIGFIDAAQDLEAGRLKPLAASGHGSSSGHDALRCHRCGQYFGDAMLQLAKHLHDCTDWPSTPAKQIAMPESKPQADDASIRLLEEMGFGGHGRHILRSVLEDCGSVESAATYLCSEAVA
eukprot:TRINITY_DN30081_c0_g1_i1.p1 TRINITY_DN30081_c0_g1~~TRINITY_DN30081_c0_g1_i1.p1  ORF type:complete len:999 (-),score=186.13 TRINITY_DN30081_c0_g1_i1:226-3222(-)